MFGLTPYERYNTLGNYDIFKEMEDFGKNFWQYGKADFKTDIIDKGKEYVLEAELPGFKKEDISVDVKDGYLTISATRNEEKDEKNEKGEYIRRERRYGSFSRSFDISQIDQAGISAGFENGVLKLVLPKINSHEKEIKKIEIK